MSVVGAARLSRPVSTPPGPSSTKVCMPSARRVSRHWRQRTGLHNWADSSWGHSSGSSWMRASTFATTTGSRAWNVVAPSALRSRSRAPAMSGVWKAPPTGIESTRFAPSSFAITPNSASASDVPATITCPGALKFAIQASPSTLPAGSLDGLVVEAEHGDHRAGRVFGRLLHGGAPLRDESEAVLEIERTGRDESRVLAQTVTSRSRRLDTDPFGRVEHDQALDESGDLGVVGTGESFLVGLEEKMSQVTPGDLRSEGDELEGRVVHPSCAHARSL